MIRIDDSLLEELGLIALPKAERDSLLKQIYETLEMRVGMKLADRMSEQQLSEFERFIDGDHAYVEAYLQNSNPQWQQSREYQTALQAASDNAVKTSVPVNETAVRSEFAALRWLETNFPDYKQVVASELEKLKIEIKNDAGHITQAVGQETPPSSLPNQQPINPSEQQSSFEQNQQ